MARWIPLSLFKDLYTSESALLSEAGHAEFIQRLNSSEGDEISTQNHLSAQDFQRFKESVRYPQSIVFYGWATQSKVLEETLLEEKVKGYFEDRRGFLKHTLSEQFRSFISPYLTPILLRDIPDEMSQLSEYFSLATLLDKDSRPTVEAQLFTVIRKQLQVLQETYVLTSEQELISVVKPLCSDAIMRSINNMSKASYAFKMEYIDAVLETIRTPACTVRFANWILKQMEMLDLNREHQQKLLDLRKELATGNLKVKKFDAGRKPIRIRPILVMIVALGLIGFLIFVMVFEPFSKAEVYDSLESAEMKDFSKDELAEIDSLVKEIEFESFMEGEEIDPNFIIQRVNQISLREPFKNPLMEQIFDDVNKDVTLAENYYVDSCEQELDFERYPGVKDLLNRSGSKLVKFRNESDYDLIIYVTDNKPSGSVYSLYVKSGMQVEFRMNVGDVLSTVAGNHFSQFYPPKGSLQEEKPSKNFKNHFCETDDNYFESINTALRLTSTTRNTIKFLTTGSYGNTFQLVDVYDVAEMY